ncbi:YfjI family protein [Verrucomicrobiales bacterium]|nr:YfjI family protein [Verrucomicrobiales bacterium]
MSSKFDWNSAVSKLNEEQTEDLAKVRGYRPEFIQWFSNQGFIAWSPFRGGRWCFPVKRDGKIVAAHQIPKSKGQPPTYFPSGQGVHPLVAGDIAKAAHTFVFESQWDAMAAMDAADFHLKEKGAYIATRGASNGLPASLPIPVGRNIFAVMQNDPEKNGKVAAEGWLNKIGAQKQWPVIRVDCPKQFEDPQDWLKKEGYEIFKTGLRRAVKDGQETFEKRLSISEIEAKTENSDISDNGLPILPKLPIPSENGGIRSIRTPDTTSPVENEEDLRPFPADFLTNLQQEIIKGYVKATDSKMPVALPAICCLGTLSAAIGPNVQIRSTAQGLTTGANIYLLAAAESSSGKSIPFKRITKPILDMESELRADYWENKFPKLKAEKGLLESERTGILRGKKPSAGDGLEVMVNLTDVEKRIREIETLLSEPRLFVSDSTSPTIVQLMARQPNTCITSISDDAKQTLVILAGKHTKTGNSDDTFFIQSWTGNYFAFDRVTESRNIVIEKPWLSALWMTQPDQLKALTENAETFNSGFFQRLLICDTGATALKFTDHTDCHKPEVESKWNALIRSLLENFRFNTDGEQVVIEPSKEAEKLLREFQNECVDLQENEFSDVPTITGKWGENAWRIALILHMAEHAENGPSIPLSIATAKCALEITRWFASEAVRAFAPAREDQEHARSEKLCEILQWKKYDLGAGVSQGVLSKSHGFKEAELRNLGSRYSRQFELIDKETTKRGGKPTFFVRLQVVGLK